MEVAAPESAEVVIGIKNFQECDKGIGKQTWRKELGRGSKQRRFSPTKCSKQANRSRTDIFPNISCYSSQSILGNDHLWQILQTLEGKYQ